MTQEAKDAIGKLKVVMSLSQAPETQQVCQIFIDYIASTQEKGTLGFGVSNEKKKPSK